MAPTNKELRTLRAAEQDHPDVAARHQTEPSREVHAILELRLHLQRSLEL